MNTIPRGKYTGQSPPDPLRLRSTKHSKSEIARVQREIDAQDKLDSKMADQRRRESEERAALDETITEWLRPARREAGERTG